MHLKRAGFFRELNHGDGLPDEPSIHEKLQEAFLSEEQNILAYLEAGSIYAMSAGVAFDYFQRPKRHAINSLVLLTDGIWLWPSDLAYYIRHYHVSIPEALGHYMKAQGWELPSLDREEIIALSRQPRY